MAVIAQTFVVVFEADNDAEGIYTGETARRVRRAIAAVIDATNKRMVRAAQAAYPWQPMASRWHQAKQSGLSNDSFVAGIYTDDPLARPIFGGSDAHWPPPNRNGIPGTGIEGWVKKIGTNPGYKTPLTAFLVQRVIADRGTAAKDAIFAIMDREAAQFAHLVGAAIFRAVVYGSEL